MDFIKRVGPGFLVCTIIAVIAKILAGYIPTIGAALFAIMIGIICGNTFLDKHCFDDGTKFSERSLLEYSIVLTGATLVLSDIAALGMEGIGYIAIQLTFTVFIAYLVGRLFGMGKKFCLLMGAGNAVCGSSAIATVSPVVDADTKDKGISITIVNITGTVLMILLPIITGILYQHDILKTSAMIGGTLQSIGQVIASADLVGSQFVPTATIFKIIRIVFIVLVAFSFSKLNTTEGESLFKKNDESSNKVKTGIPWFIIGFFIMAILNTIGIIPLPLGEIAHFVSQQFEIIALAAIGMRVKFKDLIKEGPKALCYGLSVGFCQVFFAMLMIKVFFG